MAGGAARLFVALDLPGEVRTGLERWARSIVDGGAEGATRGGVAGARVVPAASLHVTLCFLGSVEAGEIKAVGGACREAIAGDGAEGPAVRLEVDEALWLPRRRPRVLAVGLRSLEASGVSGTPGGSRGSGSSGSSGASGGSGSPGMLAALQARLAARLADGGWYRPERRPFLAHVTVARVGRGGGLDGHRRRARQGAPDGPGDPEPSGIAALTEPFAAPSVTLYRSHTDPAGARYEPLATVALRA